ncbi:MAG: class I SAM-dependent methyltransferase [Deltaproteobacteria bacterium]|nr:class I SAM-dependent methyltransferase [Deltaproteobacteria bacterium]
MLTVDFKKLNLDSGYRVLDAGCGGGRHLSEAFRYSNVTVVGLDLDREDVTKAKNTLRIMEYEGEGGKGPWGVFIGDVTSLPFCDESFDLVICSEVLEHVHDHKKAIAEIIRVLKPGRLLAVSVPRFLPERICWMLSTSYHTEPGGHVRIYKKWELVNLLESAGLKCISSGWAHALHSPYWWLKCLVGHKNDNFWLVKLYHKFLVWDIMKHPRITKILEKLLNPLISKSIVLYLRKGEQYET